ncbi:hypothetical protein Tco_0883423, partial [Tanacetum coccineum]
RHVFEDGDVDVKRFLDGNVGEDEDGKYDHSIPRPVGIPTNMNA